MAGLVARGQRETGDGGGGGDRTRTCKPARAAVFKTAALPIMLPLRVGGDEYTALERVAQRWSAGGSPPALQRMHVSPSVLILSNSNDKLKFCRTLHHVVSRR